MSVTESRDFFRQVKFKLNWRPYQRRVLVQFDQLIRDRCFHVVAAPGAGKTILGLEAIRRIGRSALILTPTLGVRDQWIHRFTHMFELPDSPPPVSTNLLQPELLTVATYQNLHACHRRHKIDVVRRQLSRAGVETLVLDEAHHLRHEWWQTLFELKKYFKDLFVISLTATPPYDVSQIEWNRYMALCGPIDAEITIPELVREHNLCPHQDFIYFSRPAVADEEKLARFNSRILSLISDLPLDPEMVRAIECHPSVRAPDTQLEAIRANVEYQLSLAVFLNHATGRAPELLLKIFGLKDLPLPKFDNRWAAVLLNGLLFHDRASFTEHEATVQRVQRALYALGVIQRRKVHLSGLPEHHRRLRASGVKLSAVASVVELENRYLGTDLRMLILTDYICELAFSRLTDPVPSQVLIGVIPIFEHIRRLQLPGIQLAVATGKLMVIPIACRDRFSNLFQHYNPNCVQPEPTPLWQTDQYLKYDWSGEPPSYLHEIVAQLLAEGMVQIVVGTNAFLGEGWDAPAINTLLLVTTTSTFVSSNQLRGRAIRTDPEVSAKTANIWHFCSFGSDNLTDQSDCQEWSILLRRFQSIQGVSFDAKSIENGVERLGIIPSTLSPDQLETINARMCREAERRKIYSEQWHRALDVAEGPSARMLLEVFIPASKIPAWFALRHSLPAVGGWINKIRLMLLGRKIRRIIRCLLEGLSSMEKLSVEPQRVDCQILPDLNHFRVKIRNVSLKEETMIMQGLLEIFDLFTNPRYVMIVGERIFAVPRIFSERRETAWIFHRHWIRYVGQARLVYSRNDEGRRILIQAVSRFIANPKSEGSFRKSCWG